MRCDTSWGQQRRGPDPGALIAASVGWLALMFAPRAVSSALDPVAAHAAVFAAVGLGLAATRRSRPAPTAPAIAVFAMAALAGYASAPAWIAGVAWLGLGLGLLPPAPAGAGAPPLVWLAAGALGPVAEEHVYRERLLRALRPAGPVAAILASSVLFALSHHGPFAMLATGCVGIALAAAMWRTGSLALCTGYHAGLNAAALAGGVPPITRTLAPATAAMVGAALAASAVTLARRLRPILACAAAVLAAPALASAELMAFEATLRLEPIPSSFPPLEIQGTGVATVNGSAEGIALETLALAGGVEGTATVPVTDPTAGALSTLEMSALLGSAALGPFHPPAPVGMPQLDLATLPVRGELRFCFLASACEHSFLALGLADTTWSGAQVGVGVGGIVTAYPVSAYRMSLHAAPWTVRTATLPVETAGGGSFVAITSGIVHGPASFTGSTALTGGALELVTPIRVQSSGSLPLPIFGRLSLHFVPEPASALLLSAGGLAIALAARRRGAAGGFR
jgi:hypothetical protein